MNVLFELDKTYEQGKADGVKEVLEKIKSEIQENKMNFYHSDYALINTILDKHIKENKQ